MQEISSKSCETCTWLLSTWHPCLFSCTRLFVVTQWSLWLPVVGTTKRPLLKLMKFKREARWWGCDPIFLANFNKIHGSDTFTTFHNGFWYKYRNMCLLVAFHVPHMNFPSQYVLCINPSPPPLNNCWGAAKLYFSDILPCLICGERCGLVTLKFQFDN